MKLESHEARNAAGQVQKIIRQLNSAAVQPLNRTAQQVPAALEGKMAEVLEEVLSDFHKDTVQLSNVLSVLQRQLIAYAEKIEEIDRKTSSIIHSN